MEPEKLKLECLLIAERLEHNRGGTPNPDNVLKTAKFLYAWLIQEPSRPIVEKAA